MKIKCQREKTKWVDHAFTALHLAGGALKKSSKCAAISLLYALALHAGAATTLDSGDLTADMTVSDELIIPAGAAVNLNGHSLTLNGKLTVQGAASITNSDTENGTKDVVLNCTNGLTTQFQQLAFSGNLKLTVSGEPSNNNGFQDAHNTHTGGTVLDGYAKNKPRFNSADAFGSTSLTLTGGSHIFYKGSSVTMGLTDLVFGGSGTDNILEAGSDVTLPSEMKLKVANGNRANIKDEAGAVYVSADLSELYGILSCYGNNRQVHLRASMPNGTLEINPSTQVRCNEDQFAAAGDVFEVGALQTPETVTYAESTAVLVNTTDNRTTKVKIGSLNTDTTFYGNIKNDYSHTKNRKDIAIEKVGSGILTLGGENEYMGSTTLSGGAIRLIGAGRLGYTSNTSDVVFNGGEFIYGDANVADPSARFKTASGCAAKVGVDDGVTHALESTLSGCGDFEKTRGGTLAVSSGLSHTGNTTVSAGTLIVPAGAVIPGALSIAPGAKILVDASAASWESGGVVTLFTVGSLDGGTTLSTVNIGLNGVSAKTAIDDIHLEGTAVKATATTKTLLWNGGNGTWDKTTANWVNKADQTETLIYEDGDKVEFAGASSYTVTLALDVAPASMTFSQGEGVNIAFAGNYVFAQSIFTVSTLGTVTLGNGKNPFAEINVTSGTLALGADQPVATDAASLYVEADAILDLNGHSLCVGYAGQRDQTGNSAIVTNSQDEVLGSLTVGVNNTWPDFNTRATLGGYMNYIVTGSRQKHFRDSTSTRPVNTISGILAVSNQTGDCRIYGAIDTGMAAIGFLGNARLSVPSSNLADLDKFQGIHVEGTTNRFKMEGYSGGATFKFNGPLTGDGELLIENGFKPSIYFNGDSSQFSGTLRVKYSQEKDSSTWRGVFFERANNLASNDGTASLEKASVVLTNETDSALNKLWIAGALDHGSIDTFPIGDLTTASADPVMYTNASLRTYKDGVVLEVGALGKSGTFAAGIVEQEQKSYHTSLVKVGDGTWTLTGTNHVYGGTTTVQGGRLNIDSAEFTAGTAIIVTNAVLGGTGTIKVPITVKEHGALAGSFTATQGATFEAGSCVEIAAEAENTPTFETDVDVANLTVKLTGELDTAQEYTILTAASGSSGRAKVVVDKPSASGAWRTKLVAGDGGVKVLTAYFVKPGLTVIIR